MTTTLEPPAATRGPSRRRPIVLAVLVLVALAAGAAFLLLRDDSPEAFDIDSAAVAVDDGADDAEPASVGEGATGTWTVDPTAGTEAGGTSAGFRIAEELATIGVTEAVGRTSGVTGTVAIDGTTVTEVTIDVDMAGLATDDSRRDNRMRGALDIDAFPTATFALTEPIELGTLPTEGETISVDAVGELTVKGTTNPVVVPIEARMVDDVLVVVGSLEIVFADYGVEVPRAAIVVSVEDRGTIEWQLFMRR